MIAVPVLRTEYPLAIRDKIERLWRMCAFRAPFGSVFQPVFGGGAAAIPWWLTGGIPTANCKAAYDAKNAASLAASYINLANPGTYDAFPGVAPTQTPGTGWIGNGSAYLRTGLIPSVNQTWSMIVRWSNHSANEMISGCSTGNSRFYIYLQETASQLRSYASGGASGFVNVAGAPGITGIMAFGAKAAYFNGITDGTIATNVGANPIEIYLMCRNNSGSANLIMIGNFVAAAIYDISIVSYIVALNAAIAAL